MVPKISPTISIENEELNCSYNSHFFYQHKHYQYDFIETNFQNNTHFSEKNNIWIFIDATNPNRNNFGGEFEFHSIFNNAPAYRNVNNIYLAYNGDEWYIMSEDRFLDGITGFEWFRIETTGNLKNFELLREFL